MEKTWRSYRQESKNLNLGDKHEVGYRPCDDQIKLGAILRIADAMELMAKKYQDLNTSLEFYKKLFQETKEANIILRRKNAGLRGYITQLKGRI